MAIGAGDRYRFKLRCPLCGWVDSYETALERDAAAQAHTHDEVDGLVAGTYETPIPDHFGASSEGSNSTTQGQL